MAGAATPRELRVLVVDDDLDTAQTLATLLHAMDCEVEFALNGEAAIQIARRFMPVVALVDLRLPDMTGWDVARALKDRALGAPRVWAMTGLQDPDAFRRSMEAGCEQHFVKPVDPALLERFLNELRDCARRNPN